MAKWPYNTTAWQKLRTRKLRAEPYCEACRSEGYSRPATAVDHRIAISQGGDAFPDLSDLASLCQRHHSIKTAAGPEAGAARRTRARSACNADGTPIDRYHPWNDDPALVAGRARARPRGGRAPLCPVSLICGAPGSGKTTLANERSMPGDIVLDLDVIAAELSGLPLYRAGSEWLNRALLARNRTLERLANVRTGGRLYFIVGAPTSDERQWWVDRLGADEVLLLAPGQATCVARVKRDDRRGPATPDHMRAIYRWHARFTPRDGDTVIGNLTGLARKDRAGTRLYI